MFSRGLLGKYTAKILYGWEEKKYEQEYWKRLKENWQQWKRNPFAKSEPQSVLIDKTRRG